MSDNAFCQPISVDRAPQGRRCEWCNKLAAHQLTAIGGIHHNQGGFFCHACGEEFARAVTKSMSRETAIPPRRSTIIYITAC
jgi:hypothetical protein